MKTKTITGSKEIARWIEASKTLFPVQEAGRIEVRGDLKFLAIEYNYNGREPRKAWELLSDDGKPLRVLFNEEVVSQNEDDLNEPLGQACQSNEGLCDSCQ